MVARPRSGWPPQGHAEHGRPVGGAVSSRHGYAVGGFHPGQARQYPAGVAGTAGSWPSPVTGPTTLGSGRAGRDQRRIPDPHRAGPGPQSVGGGGERACRCAQPRPFRSATHLRYLAKITGGECSAHVQPAPPRRDVRPSVLETLRLVEPGIAMVTNRLGDVLAHTSGFESVMSGTGLLDADIPNLTRTSSPTPAPGRSSPTGTTSRTSRRSTCGSDHLSRTPSGSPRNSRRSPAPTSPDA